MKEETDQFYKNQAKDFVNVLFNKRLLADDLSKETIEAIEDTLAYFFQSYSNTALRLAKLEKQTRSTK